MTHGTFSNGPTGRVTADVSNAPRADAQLGRAATGRVTATFTVRGH